MLPRLLQSFEPFSQLEWSRLSTLARHARLVTLPAGRWLVRPGRQLEGSCYLVQGRLRLVEPSALVSAGTQRARRPVYPGARGVQALSAVQVLRVNADPVAFLLGVEPGFEPVAENADWESRFLGSGVMQRLPPAGWQRLLRSLTPLGFSAGEHVVRRGEPADGFFVLTRGRAEVRCRGERVAVLEPGDFFGEDALITGGRRNADVSLLTGGVVMHLGGKPFLEWLLAAALRWVAAEAVPAAARELAADPLPQLVTEDGATALPLPAAEVRARVGDLDPRRRYLAVGGPAGERALAAFVLTHRGFDVVVARDAGAEDPPGLTPAPCDLAPSP